MDNYKYRLEYAANDFKSVVEFNADLDLETLRDNLRYFLLSCSWTSEQIDELLGEQY